MTALSDLQLEALLGDLESDRAHYYDVQPVPSAKLTELSRSYFEEVYHPKALAKKLLAANGRDYEERLAALRMIAAANDPTPTVLGLLTLSTNPQFWLPAAYVQFLRIQTAQTAQSALRANGNPPATFEVKSNFIFARVFPNPPAVLKSA